MARPPSKSKQKPIKSAQKGAPAGPKKAEKISVSTRRTLFVEAYIQNGCNATDAAVKAGFSPATAGQQGHRLLKNVQVASLIEQRRADLAKKNELTTESVLRSLRQALFFDPRKLFDAKGNLKAVQALDEDTALALTGFEVFEEFEGRGKDRHFIGVTKKVKWLDKNAARDQANKILGNYEKDKPPPTPDPSAAIHRVATSMDAMRAKFDKVLGRAP